MSDPIKISVDRDEMAKLQASMARFQRDTGKGMDEAVKFGGWAVASGCAAKTKVAKPYKKYVKDKTRKNTFWVRSEKRNNWFDIYAKSVKELKTMPSVRIRFRGLAKASWLWAQNKSSRWGIAFGRSKYDNRITTTAKAHSGRFGAVTFRGGLNPSLTIDNKLRYATQALRGGIGSLDGVVGRAARRMVHILDGRVTKAGKKVSR